MHTLLYIDIFGVQEKKTKNDDNIEITACSADSGQSLCPTCRSVTINNNYNRNVSAF